ncbi:copper-resistant cuproprotein CopI [Enterovibrio norvegicus]|uniref:Copper-binding protein n=1 Tax=Enterovibrio norvegicus TaxID=188144 RepID=A0ABV4L5D2_9GAMM|nr:copper-binding protein [Enterovibrio norvegicus]OEF58358.1 copper-binding protein [Enterovibrio norvegicus]
MKKKLLTLSLAFISAGAFSNAMDHSHMDHSQMNHAKMGHGKIDNTKMDHSAMMGIEGMSAVGMPANGAKPDKVVHVLLSDDMRINFKKEVNIEPNDVVQFVVMNIGNIDHEFSIGSVDEQLKHREMMKSMTNHHAHDSGSTVTLPPGKAKQLLWHFHGDSNVEFACNIPVHAEAGMVKSLAL